MVAVATILTDVPASKALLHFVLVRMINALASFKSSLLIALPGL
jgi:hypothetical protein